MSDDDGFGREIVEISAQFLALAQLAQRNGGFRDKARARKLRDQFTALHVVTHALMMPTATQAHVDALAECYRVLMGRLFDEIRIPEQPQ